MKAGLILALICSLLPYTSPIQKKCTPLAPESTCPDHSFCGISGYCVCDAGWALDCRTPSSVLTKKSQ